MRNKILTGTLGVAIFSLIIFTTTPNAHAVTNTLDATFCGTMGGVWAVDTCTLSTLYVNFATDELIVPSGVTLVISSPALGINQLGTITNNGTITISNTGGTGINLIGSGTLTNNGAIIISSTGIFGINLAGALNNNGTITISNTAGTGINITGTLTNDGTVTISNTTGTGIQSITVGTIANNDTIVISNTGGTGINNILSNMINTPGDMYLCGGTYNGALPQGNAIINGCPPPECTDDEYESGGSCIALTVCTADEYESTPPTETSDRVCTALTVCTADEYESTPPTETSDRVCTALTVCGPNQIEVTPPTATSDRVCEDIPPPTAPEHFLTYQIQETKNTPKFNDFDVILTDQFVSGDFEVDNLYRLLNPVDKNNEGLVDEKSHYVGYKIKVNDKQNKAKGTVLVENQFGTISLDIRNERLLLVPSAKNHTSTPDPLQSEPDHFKCYDVKVTKGTPNFKKIKADVYDPNFDEDRTMDVKKPRMFCNSMQTNNVIKVPNGVYGEQLLCYDVKKSKGEKNHDRTSVFTNNYFGPEELDTKKEKELCVPSTMINPGMTQVDPPNLDP